MDRFRQKLGRSRAAKIGDEAEFIINLESQPQLMTRLALLIGLLIFCLPSFGQQPVYSNSRWFKVEDGLPQSFISGLEQDRDGFLWVGTRDGLARYDGRNFRSFRQNKNDSLSLSSNVIIDLFLDNQNLLWVFYINEKLDCFDPRKLQVSHGDSLAALREIISKHKLKKFTRDRLGRFWFNTDKRGILGYDPLTNKTSWFDSSHQNLASNNNLGLVEGLDGTIYAFTEKGVDRLEIPGKQKGYFVPFDPSIRITANPGRDFLVSSLPDGRIVLGESNRLIFFDPVLKSYAQFVLPANLNSDKPLVQQLRTGKDGFLYVAAGGGVYRFEKNNQITWLWQSYNQNQFANDCKSFLIDQSSVIWFGTNAGGMAKIDLQALPFYASGYKTNFTTDLLGGLTGNDALIPGQFKEGQWAYNLRTCYDRTNRLWVSNENVENQELPLRLYVMDNNSFQPVATPPGKFFIIKGLSLSPSGAMNAIDLRGNRWRWQDPTIQPVFFPSVLGLNGNRTAVVDLETDENISWISTDKDGLFKVHNDKLLTHFSTSTINGWPSDQLTDLCKDPYDPDILWIGSLGNGLIRFKKSDGSFQVLTTEKNLPNNTVYSIVPDKTGHLWISTNNGITRFSPVDASFINFDVKDGLVGNEFNRFHHFRFPDGRIGFGGPDGYTVFDPARFKPDSFQTPIGLTGLMINNKKVEFSGDKLVLPYNQNFLQFEFAGLQFNQPEKIRYRYQLSGYDEEWIESNHNIASYTRLPAGRYRLLLNASNTSGNWSPFIKEVAIRIKPPFWATWWAYLIYVTAAVLLIRMYWRYRVNKIRMQNEIALEHGKAEQLKELDEIKDRFFSNITHELRTPLTLIMTPLEKLKQQNNYAVSDQRILSTAYKNAEQLLRLINQLLDISKIESGQMKIHSTVGDLSAFIERCIQQFSLQANNAGIDLQFINKGVSGLFQFDEEKWEKIIFNLLGNAIKFTPKQGLVSVNLSTGDSIVQLTVRDTGNGIPDSEIPKLFDRFYRVDDSNTKSQGGTGIGLSLVKELVTLMSGTIAVSSEHGKGSVFTISIPTEKINSAIPNQPDSIPNGHNRGLTEMKKEKSMVLVVEDNDELRAFLVETLSVDWDVLEAANGKLAWELALSELPDFIISDLMMPEMDGYELCSKVKEDPRTGHIGLILLSARAAHESRLAGLRKGADEYLTKPFHLDELEQRLHNLLDSQSRLRTYLQKELSHNIPLRSIPHINDVFIQDLYRKLDANIIDPNMSVELLAGLVNMSQRTLNRKLKAILNLSPVEFIRHYRLQKAAVLISSGHGITDTAYSVGFETASYFTQCFKDQYGKTPTEFAKN